MAQHDRIWTSIGCRDTGTVTAPVEVVPSSWVTAAFDSVAIGPVRDGRQCRRGVTGADIGYCPAIGGCHRLVASPRPLHSRLMVPCAVRIPDLGHDHVLSDLAVADLWFRGVVVTGSAH